MSEAPLYARAQGAVTVYRGTSLIRIRVRRALPDAGGVLPLGFTGEPPREYRGTSLTRKRTLLGPYRGPMPRVLGGSEGCGRFLMGEVPL